MKWGRRSNVWKKPVRKVGVQIEAGSADASQEALKNASIAARTRFLETRWMTVYTFVTDVGPRSEGKFRKSPE